MNVPTHSSTTPPRALLWLGAALVAGIYLIHVRHWAFLGDDAFISFRYARNFADGLGLVWNPGEYVEGYTNFLWVLILSAGMRLGIEPEGLSCLLGVLSGGGVLLLLGRFAAQHRGPGHPAVWLPLFALALSRTFSAWSTGGLETQFFALLIVAAQLRLVAEREEPSRWLYGSSLLFAFATLTRPEGGLFTAVAGTAFLVEVLRGRAAFASLVRWTLPWLAIVGSHFVWRYAYYGAWLPNTFHAKVNGLWYEQGLSYFGIFQDDYKLLVFLPFAILAVVRERTFAHGYLAAGIAVHCAYVLAIGGDRFEFRFLVVILPTLYWLIAEGLACLASLGARDAGRWAPSRLAALGVGAALLATTFLGSIRPEAAQLRHGVEWLEGTRDYAERRIEEGRILKGYVDAGVLPPDLPFATGGAGALPYHVGWPTLDTFGLNDAVVARSEPDLGGAIAHQHHATAAYMGEKGIVVFDVMNGLVLHPDPMKFAGKYTRRRGQAYRLRAVRLGEHTMVFATFVSEDELERWFDGLDILY
jgi:hypothetical protein